MYYRDSLQFPSPFPVLYWCTLFPMPFAVPFGLNIKAPCDLELHFWWPNTRWSPLLIDLNTPCGLWHLRMCVLAVKEHEVTMCWDKQSWAADGAMTQAINPLLHARTSAEIQQNRATHVLTLEWKSTCLQTVSRRTRDIYTNPSWTPERSEKPWFYYFL